MQTLFFFRPVNTLPCSFAYITDNGADWDLCLAAEDVEDCFPEHNCGIGTDELNKPDSMHFGGKSGNGMVFRMDDSLNRDIKKTLRLLLF